MSKEKNLELERLVFFSDAVVAIAITLLALDLKLEKTNSSDLSFRDIGELWPKFSSFTLSFLIIAVYWKVHHKFFVFIKKIDIRLLWYNIFWLLFIIAIPFSASLVSRYFNNSVSVFIYSFNTLLITVFQNMIWDYASLKPDYMSPEASPEIIYDYRFDCNVAMVNAILAIALSFISPIAAIIVLAARVVMMRILKRLFRRKTVEE